VSRGFFLNLAVSNGDVVCDVRGTVVASDFEGSFAVGVSDGVGDAEGVRSAGVDMSKVKPILSVVDELRMIDGGRETGSVWGADAVAIASVTLAVAGDYGDGVNDGILLVASAPLNSGVEEVPVAIDHRRCVAVVKVPAKKVPVKKSSTPATPATKA
jgi:hypothetical protein